MKEEARQLIDEIRQILREETGDSKKSDMDKFKAGMRDAAGRTIEYGRGLKHKYDQMDDQKKKRLIAFLAGAGIVIAGALAIVKSKKGKCCDD